MPVPTQDLLGVHDAHQRLLLTIHHLTDESARQPTELPGWTVGHLLTHLARNADGSRRRALGALRGERVAQYAGGAAGRAAEIDAGAARSADELVADVRRSALDLETVWSTLPEATWSFAVDVPGGRTQPLEVLPSRRRREVEIHLVDLGLGPTHREWPDDFVERWLSPMRAGLGARLAVGAEAPPVDLLDPRDELAWLFDRLQLPNAPELAPWE